MKKRIAIQGALIFFVTVGSILLSKVLLSSYRKGPVDEFLDAVGIVLTLFGFLLRISARGYKEEKSHQGRILVKDGPYSLLRNPMYFGTLMIATGIIFVLFELWTFPLFLIIFLSIYIPQIRKEEEMLSNRFDQDYRNYCKTTPKYFPKIHHLLNPRAYLSIKLHWIKNELSSLAAVITAIMAIEIWQDFKLYGYREIFKELLGLCAIILFFVLLVILLHNKKD